MTLDTTLHAFEPGVNVPKFCRHCGQRPDYKTHGETDTLSADQQRTAPGPRTAAGRALVEWAHTAFPEQESIWREHTLLIEAETAQVRQSSEGALSGVAAMTRAGPPKGWKMTKRHVYEDGPDSRCQWCGYRYANPLHRAQRQQRTQPPMRPRCAECGREGYRTDLPGVVVVGHLDQRIKHAFRESQP